MKNKSDKQDIKEKLKRIFELFLTFLKIGAFTFGGGYAMIALVEKDMVEKKKWLTSEEMLDIVAIAESTPGVIALNTATYVGAKVGGFWGALSASIAVIIPAFAIITALSTVINKFGNNQYVRWAFMGIRAAVAALILHAVCKFFKSIKKSVFSYTVMGVSFVLALLSALNVIPLNVIYILLASALTGIIYGIIKRKKHPPENGLSDNKEPIASLVENEQNQEQNENVEIVNKEKQE